MTTMKEIRNRLEKVIDLIPLVENVFVDIDKTAWFEWKARRELRANRDDLLSCCTYQLDRISRALFNLEMEKK